jgi:hypothetical protein
VSHDAGQSWSAAGATGAFRGIECDPVDPDILYVMQLTAPKVRISCDAGATLAPYDTGLVSAGASRGTFLAPTDVSSLLFFATGTGLYVTAGCGVGCALPGCEIGDLNGDCAVDIFDLAVQLSNFGATQGATAEQGDTDGDGDIDIVDLAQLLSAFGSVCS